MVRELEGCRLIESGFRRRLMAILAADASGYSRRTDPLEAARLRFRIGVHLGDVIEKPDGTVCGHGVNVAARLQALAPEGGISVSDSVRNTLGERDALRFVDQGQHAVRNIAQPLHSFALDLGGTVASGSGSEREAPPRLAARFWFAVANLRRWTGAKRQAEAGGKAAELFRSLADRFRVFRSLATTVQPFALLRDRVSAQRALAEMEALLDPGWPSWLPFGIAFCKASAIQEP
jgi:hypothetical protein